MALGCGGAIGAAAGDAAAVAVSGSGVAAGRAAVAVAVAIHGTVAIAVAIAVAIGLVLVADVRCRASSWRAGAQPSTTALRRALAEGPARHRQHLRGALGCGNQQRRTQLAAEGGDEIFLFLTIIALAFQPQARAVSLDQPLLQLHGAGA